MATTNEVVAMELASETSDHRQRRGVWVFYGKRFARIVGLPRGRGLVAGNCCASLGQLQRLKGVDAVRSDLVANYSAEFGSVDKPGMLKISSQALASEPREDAVFFDARSGIGGKAVAPSNETSDFVYVGADGKEQRWRVFEWGFDPFTSGRLQDEGSASSSASGASRTNAKNKKDDGSSNDDGHKKKDKKKDKERDQRKDAKNRQEGSSDASDSREKRKDK